MALLTIVIALQKGDEVEYKPIGGASDNVSHSTGTVTNIVEEDGVSSVLLSCLYYPYTQTISDFAVRDG